MSKALLNIDAAYALGEEAFRAGFQAAIDVISDPGRGSRGKTWADYADYAWAAYEPSEVVKDLIADEHPLGDPT